MNTSTGRVLAVNGHYATVIVDTKAACARCAEGRGCGAGLFGQGERDSQVEAVIAPHADVRKGDDVEVVFEPRGLLRAAALVYGLPLLGAVFMAAVGWRLQLPESGTVLAALAGLAAGLYVARRRLQSEACLREFTPTVVPRQP